MLSAVSMPCLIHKFRHGVGCRWRDKKKKNNFNIVQYPHNESGKCLYLKGMFGLMHSRVMKGFRGVINPFIISNSFIFLPIHFWGIKRDGRWIHDKKKTNLKVRRYYKWCSSRCIPIIFLFFSFFALYSIFKSVKVLSGRIRIFEKIPFDFLNLIFDL